nr:retrotransposon protein, putative, Ty1-copia subclass [Tanacetum cinerariifolium]
MKVGDDEVEDLGEPANYKTVMHNPDKVIWQGAMDEEMKSMKVNKVWIVVDRPPNAKVVRNKWLYKKKTDMDGKDLGEAAYILGIKIYRDRSLRLIGLNQSAYIDKILKKFNMQNSKNGFIPIEVKHDLSNEMCASLDEEKAYMKKVPYASAVGSIMYDVRCTRPDVAFAQNLVSRYQQNLRKLHWVAVKHILKYLRNTKDMFLVYGGNPDIELEVTGFCDASWQCDKDDTKSQTGYVFVVNGGAVD